MPRLYETLLMEESTPELEPQDDQSIDHPVSATPKINVWLLEKKRIWFNVILGAVAIFPLVAELLAGSRYRSKRKIISDFVFDVSPYLIKLFLVYNLFFSIIYLFERSELKRHNRLMT